MPKFKVGFYYEEGGYTEVEAKNEEEARSRVEEHLSEKGTEGLEFEQTNREYNAFDAEEIK